MDLREWCGTYVQGRVRQLWARFQASAYWKDIAWLVSGNVLAHGISLATMPLLSRIFAPTDFAILSLFITGVGFVALLASFRYEYMVQLPADDQDGWRLCQLILLGGATCTAVLTPVAWALRHWIALKAGAAGFAPWVPLIPLAAMVTSLGFAAQGWIQRQGNYRRSSTAEAVEKGVRNLVPLPLHWLAAGPAGLVLGNLLGMTAKVAFIFRRDLAGSRWSCAGLARVARSYFKLSGALFVAHFLMACEGAIPVLFMSRVFSTEVLGQFAMAKTVIALPSVLLGTAVGNAFYQRAAVLWSRGESFHALWVSTCRRLLMIALPAYLGAMVTLPFLVPFLLGSRWALAGSCSSIFAVSAFFSFMAAPLDRSCLIAGAWWYAPLCHSLRLLGTAGVAWLAIRVRVGISGFLWLLVLQQVAQYVLDLWAQWVFSRWTPPAVEITTR